MRGQGCSQLGQLPIKPAEGQLGASTEGPEFTKVPSTSSYGHTAWIITELGSLTPRQMAIQEHENKPYTAQGLREMLLRNKGGDGFIQNQTLYPDVLAGAS